MKLINVASGQFVLQSNLQKNLNSIISLMQIASKKKARILLLPECCLTGYTGCEISGTDELDPIEIENALKMIGISAKELNLFVGVGTAYFNKKGKTWSNSLVILNDKGKLQCVYDKIALTRGDEKFFKSSGKHPTFKVDNVIFGCQICFDVRFPENYREYFKKGVHVVLHAYHQAGMPEIAAQRRSLMTAFQRVRSSENAIYTISSNTIGHRLGSDQWVPTMIISPLGEIINEIAPGKTGVIVSQINADDICENIEADIRKYSAKFLGLKKLNKREIKNTHLKRKC
jgi:predicted amidohydrolase